MNSSVLLHGVGDFMKPTIRDIAKECDVSVATVSMALSDKPSRISPETRKRVRETAQRLHYMPNMAAVSLANRRSRLIGVVVVDPPSML